MGSGDVTPVSGGSEVEFNTNDATAGSTADCDVTVTEDIDSCFLGDEDFPDSKLTSPVITNSATENNLICQGATVPRVISPFNVGSNILHPSTSDSCNLKHLENLDTTTPRIYNELGKEAKNWTKKSNIYDKDIPQSSKNISALGSDKWSTSKEKFLDVFRHEIDQNIDKDSKIKPGTVVIKENYIEPPRINRISKSFHGKSPSSYLDISVNPRRASDGPLTSRILNQQPENLNLACLKRNIDKQQLEKNKRPQFMTQLSQPCSSSSGKIGDNYLRKTSLGDALMGKKRFTTTLVDEAEHAASVSKAFKDLDPGVGDKVKDFSESDKAKDK